MKKYLYILTAVFISSLLYGASESNLLRHFELLETYGKSPSARKKSLTFLKSTPVRPLPPANQLCTVKCGETVFAVDKKSGLPALFTVGKSDNFIANYSINYPLWTLHTAADNGKKSVIYPHKMKLEKAAVEADKILLKWSSADFDVNVEISVSDGRSAAFAINVKNKNAKVRLREVDFPRTALKLPGGVENAAAVIPWRRGKIIDLSQLASSPAEQRYPSSSARFQLLSFYNRRTLRDGIYVYCNDENALDKTFTESYNSAYGTLHFSLKRYPADRGRCGNSDEAAYQTIVGIFDGDWYDSAQIYRQWWEKSRYAASGKIYYNKSIPEYLKKAPVFLRFYTNSAMKRIPEHMLVAAKSWKKFLPGYDIPATHYHYADFANDKKLSYPAAVYYGFCAPLYPGLENTVRELKKLGIHTNVFVQSHIVNQNHKDNAVLKNSWLITENGTKDLYQKTWQLCCRCEPVWIRRYQQMCTYLQKRGFSGIYMDSFGKARVGFECFSPDHGHNIGGGNANDQRKLGIAVRSTVKANDPDAFIGGESCTETTVDFIDYKLNATNGYQGIVPLERALYGDYILSHGRVIRGSDGASDRRLIGQDYLEGIIFGRFYGQVPADRQTQEFLLRAIKLTQYGIDYLRFGKLLRKPEFTLPSGTARVKEAKCDLDIWQANAFRSVADNSVAVAIVYTGDGKGKNSLKISEKIKNEWNLSKNSTFYRMRVDGRLEKIGYVNDIKELDLEYEKHSTDLIIVR